ncbi:MAG: hypothetical protein KF723_23105 [Rhizobiaceae bacterium]|nr:hypothetical protein [Rhizobiaceae bacterium]
MALTDDTAPLAEVAAALGRSEIWLRRNWLKLALEHGFPRKHPSGWTWPRAAVAAWLKALPEPEQVEPANDNPFQSPEAAYRAALDARYGGNP